MGDVVFVASYQKVKDSKQTEKHPVREGGIGAPDTELGQTEKEHGSPPGVTARTLKTADVV